jgi:hypothetical protein
MNILLDINEFTMENVFLMENKENMVIYGNFIKILYSPKHFTMNGIFFDFPIKNFERKNFNGKNVVYFDIKENFTAISLFSKIEIDILEFFMKTKNIKNKNPIHTVGKQLNNGMIKYYNCMHSQYQNRFYLKISGIWETDTDIGLTYKIYYY